MKGEESFCFGIFPSDLGLDDRGHTTLLVSIFHMKATAANLLLPSENNQHDLDYHGTMFTTILELNFPGKKRLNDLLN